MKTSISELPDDLVLNILSYLPTKHAVETSLLLKKWKSLWTRVPRLEYDDIDHTRFQRFLDKSLFAHQPHVLESLCFRSPYASLLPLNFNIEPWIRTALHHHHCHLRELEIDASNADILLPPELFTCKTLVVLKLKGLVINSKAALTTVDCLPSLKTLHIDIRSESKFGFIRRLLSCCNFLTELKVMRQPRIFFNECGTGQYDISCCKTLVALKLEGLKDVGSISSSVVCLPFLKTLHVSRMVNLNNESICRLLSNCHVLSDLTLDEKTSDVLLNLDIAMPSLQRLLMITESKGSKHFCSLLNSYNRKFAIIAPSLKYFSILDMFDTYTCFIVRVRLRDSSKLEDTSIFHRIVHLELSVCSERSGMILLDLLLRSIKLVVLKLKNWSQVKKRAPLARWHQPISVPECLLSSLEALEWRGYTGRDGDKKLVSYLLNHGLFLKTANIFSEPYDVEDKQRIVEDLASMPRASKSCELVLK